MKAWLKGGLIGILIYFILIFLPINLMNGTLPTILKSISLLLGLPWTTGVSDYGFHLIISVLVNFFLIGALIGWIIGKIKSKN